MTLSEVDELRYLSDHVIDQVVSRVERGVPLQTAFRAAGVTDATLKRWKRITTTTSANDENQMVRGRILQFLERIQRAQAEHETRVLERIQLAAEATNEKTGIPEWRAGSWLLNNHPAYRETYRQQRHVEVHTSGVVHHEHQLAAEADDNQLRAWAALELPEG